MLTIGGHEYEYTVQSSPRYVPRISFRLPCSAGHSSCSLVQTISIYPLPGQTKTLTRVHSQSVLEDATSGDVHADRNVEALAMRTHAHTSSQSTEVPRK